ncbi:MAG TPA: hypothetical protein VFX30_10805 [bacterium]|nr:hypothetical protein [bacterium]
MEKSSGRMSWWSLASGTAIGVLAMVLVALAYAAGQGGFGKNDLLRLVVLSVPSLILASLAGILFKKYLRRPFVAFFLSLTVGTLIGFGWGIVNYMYWGSWLGSFTFRVAPCLIVGGPAASAFASLSLPAGTTRALGGVGLAAVIGVFGYFIVQSRLNRRLVCAETPECYGRSKRVESMQWDFADRGYCNEAIGKQGEREVNLLVDNTARHLLCSNEIAASLVNAAKEGKKAVDVVYLDTPFNYCLCSVNGVGVQLPKLE